MTRFIVQCADGTTKRLNENEGKAAIIAIAQGKPIVLERGPTLIAAHMVSKITSIKDWIDEEQEAASKDRAYICKYARRHKYDERCGCGSMQTPPDILLPEEAELLQISSSKREDVIALPEAPPTPQEIERRNAYLEKRNAVTTKMTLPIEMMKPLEGCSECKGVGEIILLDMKVPCVCITDQKFGVRKPLLVASISHDATDSVQ